NPAPLTETESGFRVRRPTRARCCTMYSTVLSQVTRCQARRNWENTHAPAGPPNAGRTWGERQGDIVYDKKCKSPRLHECSRGERNGSRANQSAGRKRHARTVGRQEDPQ